MPSPVPHASSRRRGAAPTTTPSYARGAGRSATSRIPALIAFEAVTLAAMSALHLSGVISGGSRPYDPTDAGVAEAIICVALLAGAVAMVRDPSRGRTVALAATGFALMGFIAGLTFTIRGGLAADVVYHATMLPLLIATVALLVRKPAADRSEGPER
jgi:hypothetical protein